MNLQSRLKQGVRIMLGAALTIVMFPVVLATTTFLLITGFIVAWVSAYRIRQGLIAAERSATPSATAAKEGITIEGSYHVVPPKA